MKKIIALLVAVVAFAGVGIANPAPAFGCSCIQLEVEDAIGPDATVAFIGRAVSVVDNDDPGRLTDDVYVEPRTWTFEVETVLAGDVPEQIEIGSGYGSGDCGVDFSQTGRVGVVAFGPKGRLSTGICGGVWDADLLLGVHGPGTDPVPIVSAPAPEPTDAGPPPWLWWALGALVLVGAGLAAVSLRRQTYQDGWGERDAD